MKFSIVLVSAALVNGFAIPDDHEPTLAEGNPPGWPSHFPKWNDLIKGKASNDFFKGKIGKMGKPPTKPPATPAPQTPPPTPPPEAAAENKVDPPASSAGPGPVTASDSVTTTDGSPANSYASASSDGKTETSKGK